MTNRIYLTLLLSVLIVTDGVSQWVSTGGPAGGYTDMIVHTGSIIYVSAGNGGIYRSADLGNSWQKKITGLPDDPSIQSLIEDNGLLYVSVYPGGVYVSDDSAKTWEAANHGVENITFYCMAAENGKIFGGNANGGVYFSPDGGTGWQNKSSGISDIQFLDLKFFNGKIYAGGRQLFESSDDGDSWLPVTIQGLDPNGVQSMFIHNNIFYVADGLHVFISEDSLQSWTLANIDSPVIGLNMGEAGDSVFVTTDDGKICVSSRNTNDWSFIGNSGTNSIVNNALFISGRIIMCTSEGLYISTDNGNTWVPDNTGIVTNWVKCMNDHGSYLFAGTDRNGVFRFDTRDSTWITIRDGLTDPNSITINDIISIDTLLVAGTGNASYTSGENKNSWILGFDPGINKGISALDFNKGVMAAAVNTDGVYLSNDTAKTWTLTGTAGLETDLGYEAILLMGDTIITGTNTGKIFRSVNTGTSWTDISIPGGNVGYIYQLRLASGKLFAATSAGLYLSTDLGNNWSIFGNDVRPFHDLRVVNNKIFAATSGGILMTSLKRNYWTEANSGFDTRIVESLLIKDNVLYAGTFSSGVWSRSLDDLNLSPVILGISDSIVTKEDSAFNLPIGILQVEDPDNTFPDDYSVIITEGEHYTVNGTIITPEKDFNGTLTIPVMVNDGISSSQEYDVMITVTPVNDPPVIEGTATDLATQEETPIDISPEDLNVNDPDNTYPQGFTITVEPGENYTLNGNQVIPDPGFTGNLEIKVIVSDGTDNSQEFLITVSVTQVLAIPIRPESGDPFLFPNPARGHVNINFKNRQYSPGLVTITDLAGQTVWEEKFSKDQKELVRELNIDNLRSGLYILILSESGRPAWRTRLIIE